ncbi:MAG: hypothetical protein ACPH8E_06745, partial [Flavobacteriales bacterium]
AFGCSRHTSTHKHMMSHQSNRFHPYARTPFHKPAADPFAALGGVPFAAWVTSLLPGSPTEGR